MRSLYKRGFVPVERYTEFSQSFAGMCFCLPSLWTKRSPCILYLFYPLAANIVSTIHLIIRIMDTPNPPSADSNIGGLLLALIWSLAGLSAGILGLRLYTGAFILHRIKLSDYLMIMAFVSVASALEPTCAKANIVNRFALSSKPHSLPPLFIGVWVDIHFFSMTMRCSILWSSLPCAKDGGSPAWVSDEYHSACTSTSSSAHLAPGSGSFTFSLELRCYSMLWQLSWYMRNVAIMQRRSGIPISVWNVGVHLCKEISAFFKAVSLGRVLEPSSC